jgi:thymidylate synthase
MKPEQQYLDLVSLAIEQGYRRPAQDDRTGVATRVLHGATMRFDLSKGQVPLLTTKRVPYRAVVRELLWFLSGVTNIRPLLQHNVHIWSDWPHAKFVQHTGEDITMTEFEQRVLRDHAFAERWGDLGPVYGKQWRRWQAPDGREIDQLSDLVRRLRQTPDSRRLLFHGWNVADIDQMALPPCHLLYQCFVAPSNDGGKRRLSLTLYQRSCDLGLGVPFNVASAATLVHMLAQQVDMLPGELFWVGHDVHVYENHVEPLRGQLLRTPGDFPTLGLVRRPADLFSYEDADFQLDGYNPQAAIPMAVAV